MSKHSFNGFRRSGYGKVAILVVAGAILILAAILHHSQLSRNFSLATTRKPQTFTELYFTDYNALPRHIVVGKTYAVPFTTVNHETETVTYTYQVQIVEAGAVQAVESGSFRLGDTNLATHIIRYSAQKPGDQVEVIISLPGQSEEIDYRTQS